MYQDKNLYDRLVDRFGELEKIREPWETPCDEIIDIFRPDLVRFADSKDGDRNVELLGEHMFEGTAAWSARLMSEGWQGYLVSRSIEWFQHVIGETHLRGNDDVNKWLQDFDEHMYSAYGDSTFYESLGSYCRHGVTVGSPVVVIEEDEQTGKVYDYVPHPAERYLAQNAFGETDTLYLKRERTVKEAYELYAKKSRVVLENGSKIMRGNDAFSTSLQYSYNAGQIYEKKTFIKCFHFYLDPIFEGLMDNTEKPTAPWMAYTLELGNDKKKICKIERYWTKPFIDWPYEKDPAEVYARTPAWYCYYDNSSLQESRQNLMMAGSLATRPPMWIPAFLKKNIELYPEGMNFYANSTNREDMPKPIITGENYSTGKDMDDRFITSVERWFHVPFFLMLSKYSFEQKAPPTAYHVMQMAGERAVLLAPRIGNFTRRLEQIDNRHVDIESRAGRLPEPPPIVMEESEGKLNPEFIGPLTQVQQQYHSSRRMGNTMMQIEPFLNIDPMVRHKIRAEVAVERILEKNRFIQDAIVSDDEYKKILQAFAQAEQERQAREVASQAADAVPKLSKSAEEGSPLAMIAGAA